MELAGERRRFPWCLLTGHRYVQVEETSLLPPGEKPPPGPGRATIRVFRCRRCGKPTWR